MPDEPVDTFDDVRERAAGELEADHYAAFLVIGVDDNGDCLPPHVAVDGNRIPSGMSRAQVVAAMVAQVLRDRMPTTTVAELILDAAGIEASPVGGDE